MPRILKSGLIRVEREEWPAVKARLLGMGYVWHQDEFGERHCVWSRDLKKCLSQFDQEGDCYWLDEELASVV